MKNKEQNMPEPTNEQINNEANGITIRSTEDAQKALAEPTEPINIQIPAPQQQAPQKYYNRRERRNIEHKLKLLDISGRSREEQAEIREKRRQFGASVHRKFVQDVHNRLREEDAQREAKQYQDLVELWGEEKANKIMDKQRERQAKKRAKK